MSTKFVGRVVISEKLGTVTVTVPTQTRGDRIVSYRRECFTDLLTDQEALLANQIEDSAPPSGPFQVEFDLEELKLLASIANKFPVGTGQNTATPAQPLPVAAIETPKPSFPVPQKREPVKAFTNSNPIGNINNTAQAIAVANKDATRAERKTNNIESKCEGMKATVEAFRQSYYAVDYDIPDDSGIGNPSKEFWRYGFRHSRSIWVFSASALNEPRVQAILNSWENYNNSPERNGKKPVKFGSFKWDADETGKLLARAEEMLREHLIERHTALIKNIDAADQKLAEALAKLKAEDLLTNKSLDLAQRSRMNAVRAQIRAASEELSIALECAERYDLSEKTSDLFDGLRAAIRSQRESFNILARDLNVKTV